MFEKKLEKLLIESNELRQLYTKNTTSDFYCDDFNLLTNFLFKNMGLLKKNSRKAKIIANHFDEILPYIVSNNINVLLINFDVLLQQSGFKEKFIEGLIKYPYKQLYGEILSTIWSGLNDQNKIDEFMDFDILNALAKMKLNQNVYVLILNNLGEEKQRQFLEIILENNIDIHLNTVNYKGNNKQFIIDNIECFMVKTQDLYGLMNFVKYDQPVYLKVQKYIDDNLERSINSLLNSMEISIIIKDPVLLDSIKLVILDVLRNEKVKLSSIKTTFGGFSYVLLIGSKVIKVGLRYNANFPNNPYIVAPLLRQEFRSNNESCFVEVTERVDTDVDINADELYNLYKKLRDLGLIWTDIKSDNVGRLRKENIIHWKENLYSTDKILSFSSSRVDRVLKEGDLVIIDADFIFDENDPNITYGSNPLIVETFEKKYQSEKSKFKANDSSSTFSGSLDYELPALDEENVKMK